jgi:hypothetical protein
MVIDGLPRREVTGQQASRTSAFESTEDRVEDLSHDVSTHLPGSFEDGEWFFRQAHSASERSVV